MPDRCDVAVLGAGAAGLAAACDLARAGLDVHVLEARDRCGGRIHTHRDADAVLPVELGAEFVHGRSDTVFDLVDAARLCAVELPDRHWTVARGRHAELTNLRPRIANALARLGRGADRPLGSQLGRVPARQRRLVTGFVEGYHGADLDRVSSRWLAADAGEADPRQYRILDGYDRLLASPGLALPRGVLHLRTIATEVAWRRGRVTVGARTALAERREFRARALVCSVPLGVLQAEPGAAGAIRFSPDLADRRRDLARLAMGQVSKTILVFRERFWAKQLPALEFGHAFDRLVPTVWTEMPMATPTLIAWSGGSRAVRLLGLDPARRLAIVLREIGHMLGESPARLARLLATSHHHDWRADPLSRGAYAYVTAGGERAPARLARPVEDTLFFAGEATDADQMGTVAGALDSGHRAAKQVLAALQKG